MNDNNKNFDNEGNEINDSLGENVLSKNSLGENVLSENSLGENDIGGNNLIENNSNNGSLNENDVYRSNKDIDINNEETVNYTEITDNVKSIVNDISDEIKNENDDIQCECKEVLDDGISNANNYNVEKDDKTLKPECEDKQEKSKEACYKETVKKKSKKFKNSSFSRFVAACLIISIAGGGSIGAGFALTQSAMLNRSGGEITENVQNQGFGSALIKTSTTTDAEDKGGAVKIIKDVFPSVVNITTKATMSKSYFNGLSVPYEASGAGSGIIFYEDETKAYVATNAHVIDGATSMNINISGTEQIPATIVGTDTASELAVLSVLKSDLSAVGITEVKTVTFGDSDLLEVGENVIAIGNALGEGKISTGGMISAAHKEIVIDGKKLEVIQTDAAINPGNSGGALVNYKGEVVGINTAKSFESAVEGMGYAIPSNVLIPIIEKLLTDGAIEKPYLGIVGNDVTSDLSQLYGLPVGVLVVNVLDGSSAQIAGVKPGDIIIDFGGTKIMNMDTLVETLTKQTVGASVDMRIIRDGRDALTINVVIQDANKA